MDMEVSIWCIIYKGKEVALFVKAKFVEEFKKLQSFKDKDYEKALKEIFIRMDELLK